MNTPNQNYMQLKPNRMILIMGGIIAVGFGLYYGFMAINSMGMEKKEGTAIVIAKDYRPPGKTYVPQVIGGRTYTIPQTTAEMYILELDIDGQITQCVVDYEFYQAIKPQNQVKVVYQQLRITGNIQVLEISGKG